MAEHSALLAGRLALSFREVLPNFLAFLFKEGTIEDSRVSEDGEDADWDGYTRLVTTREKALRQMDERGYTIPFFAAIYEYLVEYSRPYMAQEVRSELVDTGAYTWSEAQAVVDDLLSQEYSPSPVDALHEFITFAQEFLAVPFDSHARPYVRHFQRYEQGEIGRLQRWERPAGEHLRFFLPHLHLEPSEDVDYTTLDNVRRYVFQDAVPLTRDTAQMFTVLCGMTIPYREEIIPLVSARLMLEVAPPGSLVVWDVSDYVEDTADLRALRGRYYR